MGKITAYKFVAAIEYDGQAAFIQAINDSIGEGWQPYGPLIIVNKDNDVADVIQPMVKYQGPFPIPNITGNLG